MLASWVVRSSSNPISQDASSIFQAQNGLPQVDHPVGIGEECHQLPHF
jgi:hypothetical protein